VLSTNIFVVTDSSGDRSKFFPAIEKKHGGAISLWIERLKELGDAKYPEQIAFLRENHAFSQAHANALVMYVRGSETSKRFKNPKEFFASIDPVAAKTAQEIFSAITTKYPDLELVIAWTQPMLRLDTHYIIGLSVAKNHITLNPFSGDVLESFTDKLSKYVVNKHTFQVPIDWKVDAVLLRALATARLKEIK
jgi:uncharacterized protein YdhG (YjbR/CyaY superfamily)